MKDMTESEIRLECLKEATGFVNMRASLSYEREITEDEVIKVADRFNMYVMKGS